MSVDQYVFSCDELIICDPELGIEMTCASFVPRLPLNLQGPDVVEKGGSIYLVSEGRRHGECRLFTEEGGLRASMFYLHGKLHGPSVAYGENGKVLSKTWYCEGKKMGKAHFYSTSGALVSLQRFKGGEWEGVQEYFYEDGSPRSLIPFQAGKLHGAVQLFWESGIPKRLSHYTEGLREGMDSLWSERGILIDEGKYEAGQPVHFHRRYYANGALKEEFLYHTPLRFDRKEWSESGKLLFEGTHAPDLTYTERVSLEPHGTSVRKGVWNGDHIRWK